MAILTESEREALKPAGWISVIYHGTTEVFRTLYTDHAQLEKERGEYQKAYILRFNLAPGSMSSSEEQILKDEHVARIPFGARRIGDVPADELREYSVSLTAR